MMLLSPLSCSLLSPGLSQLDLVAMLYYVLGVSIKIIILKIVYPLERHRWQKIQLKCGRFTLLLFLPPLSTLWTPVNINYGVEDRWVCQPLNGVWWPDYVIVNTWGVVCYLIYQHKLKAELLKVPYIKVLNIHVLPKIELLRKIFLRMTHVDT